MTNKLSKPNWDQRKSPDNRGLDNRGSTVWRTEKLGMYGVHLRTKINDKKMIFDFQKQDNRRRNHNKRSRDSSI